ncbi:5'-nucleotidase C-terminal domain-containing protein [Paenibacillus senegalensis]|uniref:5'-nucleotidase C-terminal domain-containing protein n=1 Tax=Paenibacillus senegalensis TaxID=1465766 RepID=UPI0004745BA4
MKQWKNGMTAVLAALLLISVWGNGAGIASAEEVSASSDQTITIVHTNDIHSRVEESDSQIGYAKLSTIIKQMREANPNTVVLDAGDTFHGQTIANLVRGESIVRLLNEVGYDAMAPGNHDFNFGSDRLQELAGLAEFPVLAANVYRTDGTRLLEPYIFVNVGDARIAIFGLATPETVYKTHPDNVSGLTFANPVEEARKVVGELEGQADIVIALAHLGLDESSEDTSRKLAQEVGGIDVIIDGHSHTTLENGLTVGDTLIAQTGEYSYNVGVVEIALADGEVVSKQASLMTRAEVENVEPDHNVLSIIEEVKTSQEEVLSEVIGSTAVFLDGERENVRTGETNLGNLITDAMLDETGADIALTNGGGIRASIAAGDITKGDVITVLPFGNYIQTKKVTGAELVEALEHGVGSYPDSLGAFPHVSGMTFKIDENQPKGSRVHSAIIQGQPLDLNQTYLLATNDFLAAGGDDYTAFQPQPLEGDFSSLEESVIRYVQSKGTVDVKSEGRITVAAKPGALTPPVSETPAPTPTPPATETPEQPEAPAQPEPTEEAWAPVQPEPPVQPETGGESGNAAQVYVVQSGDNLSKIARMFNTTWQTLQRLNHLHNPHLIFPGQQIVLP